MAQVEVNRLSGYGEGAAEILYLSQVYGYGRYVIGVDESGIRYWSVF